MKKILLSVLALSILLPTLAFASFDISLKYGSKGDSVSALQDFLQNQGEYSGKIDGWFGLGTLKAVEAFQSANSLQPDGYFGIASRTKANSILATILAPSNSAEQTETGTATTNTTPTVAGCTSTSLYSSMTGQPCTRTIQPTTPNLPEGCTSTSGFSVTTGQSCNGITNTIQQIQQNTQQITQNNTLVVTPTSVSTPITYSNYVLNYSVASSYGEYTGVGTIYNPDYVFPTKITRQIDIKKMVVQTNNMPAGCLVGLYTQNISDNRFHNSSANIPMQETSNNIWEYNKDANLQYESNSPVISFQINAYDCGGSSVITPLFSQWVVWDGTSNLPVKIVNSSDTAVQ
jgi:peptidoglycan hydrolase-like protein with peptidoglycan-binding domain